MDRAFLRSPLLHRIILFIFVFVVISGLSGSWLISKHTLLFPFHFWIYGSAGKVLLFGMVAFLILAKDKVFKIPTDKLSTKSVQYGIGSAVSLGVFFVLATRLLSYSTFADAPVSAVATHLMLWVSGICAALAVFGFQYIKKVLQECWREFLVSFILATIFYFAFSTIFKLWPYLSNIVLWAVTGMLRLTYSNVTVIPPLTIQLPQFSVTVGEYCSGIESLFLITTLYILIGCMEWKRLRKSQFFLYYCPLILGMFVLNIVRVYGIIQAGIWISPEVAAKLFHTYLGMILFMLYFFIFLKYALPKLLKPNKV